MIWNLLSFPVTLRDMANQASVTPTKNGPNAVENSMGVPQKTKNKTSIYSSNFIREYLPKGNETNAKRYMHPSVYFSIIHNIQEASINK